MKHYKKIDIYVDGKYVASTTQARTLEEAKNKFIEACIRDGGSYSFTGALCMAFFDIKAVYASSKRKR